MALNFKTLGVRTPHVETAQSKSPHMFKINKRNLQGSVSNLTAWSPMMLALFLGACQGPEVLNRGTKDGKPVRSTPSLHTVPERPQGPSPEERQRLEQQIQQDYAQQPEPLFR